MFKPKDLAKRSQQFNATSWIKFENGQFFGATIWMGHDVALVWTHLRNIVALGPLVSCVGPGAQHIDMLR